MGMMEQHSSTPFEDTLSRLIQQEREINKLNDNICQGALHEQQCHNDVWREKVVQWCYGVVDHLSVDREIVFITMNILDRFIAVESLSPLSPSRPCYYTDKKAYQLAVMTCFLMSMKLQGNTSFSVTDLIKMNRYSISLKEVGEIGKRIVKSLFWNQRIPTPARIVHALTQLLPKSVPRETKQSIFEKALFQVEVSVCDCSLSRQLPSTLAWAALENAIDNESSRTDSLSEQVRSTLTSCIARLAGKRTSIYAVRCRLRKLDERSCVSHDSSLQRDTPTLIHIDEEIPQRDRKEQGRLNNGNVVSLDDIPSIATTKLTINAFTQSTCEELSADVTSSSIHRTKRARFV